MDTKEKVREFLVRNLRKENLKEEDNFFEQGLANSLFMMQLIMFIEEEFDVTVENDDMELSNFCTWNQITAFIESKKQ